MAIVAICVIRGRVVQNPVRQTPGLADRLLDNTAISPFQGLGVTHDITHDFMHVDVVIGAVSAFENSHD